MIGTAKITSNEGAGKYKITQMFWDGSASFVTGNVGLVQADATDFRLKDDRSVDDLVVFQMQETYPGLRQAVISGSVAATTAAGDSFFRTFTFSITGDKDWFDVDTTASYKNVTIIGVAHYDAGPPVVNGDPFETDIEWANSRAGGGYITQTQGQPSQLYLTGNAVNDPVLQLEYAAKGDFWLRSDSSGNLQAKSDSHLADFYVQVSLWVTGTMTQADPITLS